MSDAPSIYTIKGVGEKTGKLFEKLGVHTVDDLLKYYPRAYDTYQAPVPLGSCVPEQVQTVAGTLPATAGVKKLNHLQVVTASIQDDTGRLGLTWFNMPFLRTTLRAGCYYLFRGRVVRKNGRLCMEQPEIFTPAAYGQVMGHMQPIYAQTKGLGNKAIVKAVRQALEARPMERDYLPEDIRGRHELAELNYASAHIHFPTDGQTMLFARKRLVFDEFFLFLLAVRRLKESRVGKRSAFPMRPLAEVERLKKSLPYSLTDAQEHVWREVLEDMAGGQVMNRLIQGDVGSGKTIVAVLALVQAALSGYQGALMVPTEVLARQHFESMGNLFSSWGLSVRPILLTGSMTAKEKRQACEAIASHQADIIVGTHAIIQDKVVYDDLALVITDEQHRFGVHQREALGQKGRDPHVLVMSATPIPRTLAIILYGDLDLSVIDQLPASRLPIRNCVVDPGYRQKAYRFITQQVQEGRQAYVICPMVEESEMIEAENVLDYCAALKQELPPSVRVEYLHGKMRPREKNEVMERFSSNEVQVLVSTTVVEVGVDVPNATVMMIENAERYGLAQLHQLRGRVGRGEHQSYCILVNTSGQDEAQERLEILNRSNDGFYIASEDLKIRGPGDIFGIRQSGDLEFRLADIFTDAKLLKAVSEEVGRLLEEDPMLKAHGHEELGKRLDEYLTKSYGKLNL